MKHVRTALAAALALATLPAIAQQKPFTQTVFFGDSLTDAGTFRPVLIQIAGPGGSTLGRFTTNPGLVWAEFLAEYYGTGANASNQGGTNYATGGARIGVNSTTMIGPVTVPVPSLATQVTSYLNANGGRADPNALFTVWGGANDLFAIGAGAPLSTLGTAVAGQIGIVSTLTAAGARYILVPTLPDMGLTPAARAQGPAGQAQFTQLSSTYNTSLFNGLASANLRVIPLDTFNLLREVVANPAPFGITNFTSTACLPALVQSSLTCSTGNYATPNASSSFLFADGVHPSVATHEVLADYAVSVLEAPRRVALLGHSASVVGRARADRIDGQLAARSTSDAEGTRWWVDARGDFQRYEHGDLYDGAGPALTAGADWRSGNLVYGAFAGFGRSMMDWGRRGGSFDQNEATLGGYLGWRAGAAWINGQVGYTQLDFDIERQVDLGRATRMHRGSTDGRNLTAGVEGGWEFGSGMLKHGPVLGVLAQRIDIDGFAEDQATLSTSLAYLDQNADSLVGKAGWQLRADTANAQPYARVTFDHEFEDGQMEAFARSQSLAGTQAYAVPAVQFDGTYATGQFGVRTEVFGLSADVGAIVRAGQKGGNDATLFLTVGGTF